MRENLGAVALTRAGGLGVDDALGMSEKIVRHMETGDTAVEAALKGARQIGFTVVSITVSLIAAFIPLFFMGGYLGRFFREFSVTLTAAVVISGIVSLTLTPAMCGRFLRRDEGRANNAFQRACERALAAMRRLYEYGLRAALAHRLAMLLATFAICAATIWLYRVVPKGFFPPQETGIIRGITDAAQDISFAAMTERQKALKDVSTDQQINGLQAALTIDRDAASRLGVSPRLIDNTLYDAFGQRQVSTVYAPLDQFRTVLEVDPALQQDPATLRELYVKSTNGKQVPLSEVTKLAQTTAPLSVAHQGEWPAATISFNLAPDTALSQATDAIHRAEAEMELPPTLRPTFQGNARAFRAHLHNMPLLILAAVIAVYIILGMLYESLIHPLTIISTLPP